MNKPRLAIFNTQPPHLYYGGVERRIMETTKRLQNELEITIYAGTKAGFRTAKTLGDVKLFPVKSSDKLFPMDNWTFNRNISAQAGFICADVFEAHAVSAYNLPKKLHQLTSRKPFIHTVHGVLADEYNQAKAAGYSSFRDRVANMFMRNLAKQEKQMAKQADIVVTISRYSLKKLKQYYNVDESKVRIVPNGVDTDIFKPAASTEEARRSFNLGSEPIVLFVGNLIPRKGPTFLLDAAKKVVKKEPETKFIIVGDGPLKQSLIQSAKLMGLSGNFVFLGKLPEAQLPKIYACADVFVLPSIQEGQGIVLLEAQACGKPVLAFDVGGVGEAVQDSKTGRLVNCGDSLGLAEALLELLADNSLRAQMGCAGRMFVEENFTWDLCAARMLNVYREALASA
jgi:glycosyltransferase involved in cell wall biosynthesis